MSLQIHPTFPKIRADQLDLVNWTQVSALMNIINTGDQNATNNAVNQALSPANLDPAVARIVNTPSSATQNNILGLITPAFLDPRIANQINTTGTQTRNAINSLINASNFNYQRDIAVSATNWDTLTSRGYYRVVPGGSGGSSIPPFSTSENGVALILPGTSGQVTQVIIQPSLVVSREFNGSIWTNWRLASGGGLRHRAGLTANTALSNSSATPTTVFSFTPTTNFGLASGGGIATLILTVRLSFTASAATTSLVGGVRVQVGGLTVAAWPLAFSGDLSTLPISVQFTAILQVTNLALAITVQAYGNNTAVSLRGGAFWDDPNPSQTLLEVTVA